MTSLIETRSNNQLVQLTNKSANQISKPQHSRSFYVSDSKTPTVQQQQHHHSQLSQPGALKHFKTDKNLTAQLAGNNRYRNSPMHGTLSQLTENDIKIHPKAQNESRLGNHGELAGPSDGTPSRQLPQQSFLQLNPPNVNSRSMVSRSLTPHGKCSR